MSNINDDDYAKLFKKWKQKHYPRAKPQHLESYLLDFLAGHVGYTSLDPLEQLKMKHRVMRIVRSEAGVKGAVTRKENLASAAKKAAQELAASAQHSFDFKR